MKISIALSVLILAVGLSTGFLHQRQLVKLREERTQLAVQAAKPGITKHQREEALGGLARSISGESFESVTSWMANQKLTPDEIDRFAAGLSYDTTKADTGKWIDWMKNILPAVTLDERVGDLVGQWTQEDYLAAGKWLAAEPDGAAKTAAVKSYAETVAEYEPQVAARWAMTLPAGEERDATLKCIYGNWPDKDAAAKAAFAAEHGIDIGTEAKGEP